MYSGVKFALLRSIRCNKRVWPGELLGTLGSGHTTRIAKCNTDSGVVTGDGGPMGGLLRTLSSVTHCYDFPLVVVVA